MKNEKRETPWQITKIIEVANELNRTGGTAASMGERIAAAFVLNKMEYLPDMYKDDVLEAWDRLDHQWKACVRVIKRKCMHHIKGQ